MPNTTLIKNFTIGFIPLIIFIIADEFFGTTIGLITAIAVGLAELVYYYIRFRRIESFVLFDVSLILILGGISLALHDELFFKLKPALIELILVILVGINAFSNKPLLLMMGQRYLKGLEINDLQALMMKKMSRLLFFVVLAHVVLVVYAAYFMSKEAWAFISGGLFYIIFGLIFGGQWLYFKWRGKRKPVFSADPDEEWFDLVSEQGEVIGKAPRAAVHGNPQLLHPVVHLHIFNKQGQLYLQKRALSKDVQPGKWDTAVGGHLNTGEAVVAGLKREAEEELGIKDPDFHPLYRYVMRNEYESELVHTFRMYSNGPFKINTDEILFGKFWSVSNIRKNLGKQIFTPNFEQEFALLQKIMEKEKKRA